MMDFFYLESAIDVEELCMINKKLKDKNDELESQLQYQCQR